MMSEAGKNEGIEILFPYYVNQGRLLDIYSIFNGGYSEYSEITTTLGGEKTKGTKAEASGSVGFKIFNIGSSVSGERGKTDSYATENKEKKVQTVTSILSLVKKTLSEKGLLKEIRDAKPGQFICIPVNLSINSIKSLLSEMSELVKLMGNMQKVGAKTKGTSKDVKSLVSMINSIRVLFGGEEILYQAEDFAIIGNIVDANLYQSVRADIIGTELKCLAQVKRIFPDGTELMKNTIFTRVKDHSAKETVISAMSELTDGSVFDFEAVAVASIYDKPVYQVEIIALYQ